jgi:pantothenate kinase
MLEKDIKMLFDQYASDVASDFETKAMNICDFTKFINERYEKLQGRFSLYQKCLNEIDDFFEYRHKNLSNKQIKEIVMNYIDIMSKRLQEQIF